MNDDQSISFDLDYLRRCKASTPEQRLDWLAAAQEFASAKKTVRPFSFSSEKAPKR
ncbi:hypothetical protein HY213_05730 [Candidatus Peregrinibacteria bacterium]|nr:hypothetical protein [Candidatus Peregrinibacteria bacterium]